MSGHSKWAKIKHKKAISDAKKGKIFTKLAQQITIAAREGGDSDSNFSLRLLADKARAVSMPADNIQRAIDRGAGKGSEAIHLERVTYEGIGQHNVAMIIETLTDNKNRTVSDIRQHFNNNGGSLAAAGAVMWNFDQFGEVLLKPGKMQKSEKYGHEDNYIPEDSEEVSLALMDIPGIEDISGYHDGDEGIDMIEVRCEPKQLMAVRDAINDMGYVISSAELVWKPKMLNPITPENKERILQFIDELEENDSVQSVWSDADLS